MKISLNYFAVLSGVMLSATLAHAEPKSCDEKMHGSMHGDMSEMLHGSREEMMFQKMDRNADGTVTKREFKAFNDQRFKEMDANQDGKLTRDDMQGAAEKTPHNAMQHSDGTTHLDRRFIAADANHDGGLDREEAKNMPMLSMYYDEVDVNKDGKVTRQEYFDAMPLLHGGKKMEHGIKPNTL